MAYTSKALIHARGTLYLKVKITDHLGNSSTQVGNSHQVMRNRFRVAMEEAILNAQYKHFNKYGYKLVKTDEERKGGSSVTEIEVIDAYITYYGEYGAKYEFKRSYVNGKYYSDTIRNGKVYQREKYIPITTEMLQKNLDDSSFGDKGKLRKGE